MSGMNNDDKQSEMEDNSMRIAPKGGGGYWTVKDWESLDLGQDDNFGQSTDWDTAIQIFEDRIKFRFIEAIETLKREDDKNKPRRFGFAATSLISLLIETLAQFYAGKCDESKANDYINFMACNSLVLKRYFSMNDAERFYKTIRCGLLHQAETKENSLIWYQKKGNNKNQVPFEPVNDKSLIVYWATLFELLKREIEEYKQILLAKEEFELKKILRENFKKKMNHICRLES